LGTSAEYSVSVIVRRNAGMMLEVHKDRIAIIQVRWVAICATLLVRTTFMRSKRTPIIRYRDCSATRHTEVCMKQRLIIVCMVLVVSAALHAERFIANTGPGPETLPGFSLGGLQWVAVEFDVPDPATITRIDGWMLVSREGNLVLSLYSDGGEVPGELLFRSRGFVTSGTAGWRGLSSLDWAVSPGTYWIGFEPQSEGAVLRMDGALPFPSKRPLQNGALVDLESDLTYVEADAIAQMGLRIFADRAD
jgi:hypothetical protein